MNKNAHMLRGNNFFMSMRESNDIYEWLMEEVPQEFKFYLC